MSNNTRMRRLLELLLTGIASSFTSYIFTILYLRVMWLVGDPRWGLPFFWFIPHGIEGLHFHHDIEFFIITPVAMLLAGKRLISKDLAFVLITFFLGMALHHWQTEGLVIVSLER